VDADEVDERLWFDAAKAGDLPMLRGIVRVDPSFLAAVSTGIGHSALHWCAARGHASCIEFLLQSGADPHQTNHGDSTPLHAAAANGQMEAATQLLGALPPEEERRALAAQLDGEGQTAAQIAADRGHAELAAALAAPLRSSAARQGRISGGLSKSGDEDEDVGPTPHVPRGGGAAGGGGGAAGGGRRFMQLELESWEIDTLIEVLGELGDRREPPLSARQKKAVAKLGGALFAHRLNF
jgi:hypothetical protein